MSFKICPLLSCCLELCNFIAEPPVTEQKDNHFLHSTEDRKNSDSETNGHFLFQDKVNEQVSQFYVFRESCMLLTEK